MAFSRILLTAVACGIFAQGALAVTNPNFFIKGQIIGENNLADLTMECATDQSTPSWADSNFSADGSFALQIHADPGTRFSCYIFDPHSLREIKAVMLFYHNPDQPYSQGDEELSVPGVYSSVDFGQIKTTFKDGYGRVNSPQFK